MGSRSKVLLGIADRLRMERVVRRFVSQRRRGKALHARRARILDGVHLWLTIAPTSAGDLVTRTRSGGLVPVGDPVPSGPQTLCLPLAELPGSGPGGFPLYFRSGDTLQRIAVDRRSTAPTDSPDAPDGDWRYRLVDENGTIMVHRDPAPRAGRVTRVGADETTITVRWQMSERTTGLALVDEDGVTRTTFPVLADGADWYAEIPGDIAIPTGDRLALNGEGASPYPLVRDRNALRKPQKAVPMPSVAAAAGGRLGLRWSPRGFLRIERRDASL